MMLDDAKIPYKTIGQWRRNDYIIFSQFSIKTNTNEITKISSFGIPISITGCGRNIKYNMGKTDDIASKAESCEYDTGWAKDVAKTPNYCQFQKFEADIWKCNLFISDMLYRAGVTSWN